MKKLVILSIIAISCHSSYSQKGYLGKKTLLRYEIASAPALINPTLSNDYGINKIHNFSLEYSTGSSTQLGVGISYNKTRVAFDETVQISVGYDNYYGTSTSGQSLYPVNYTPDFTGEVATTGYNFYINLFGRKSVSLIGKYHQFKASLHKSRVTIVKEDLEMTLDKIDDDYYSSYDNISVKTMYPNRFVNEYNYTSFSLSYGMYYQRILFGIIPINFGVQFGWMSGGFLASDQWNGVGVISEIIGFSTDLKAQNYILKGTRARLSSQGVLNFKLGFGFLAI
ncbi:MAG: hypothetical protein JKY53_11910 [Flavobacteriales bacterium]|nr:hypothetical protein [Flavobacteriales bacterium]